MTITCPHCHTECEGSTDLVGVEVRCPNCRKEFVVGSKPSSTPVVCTSIPKRPECVKTACTLILCNLAVSFIFQLYQFATITSGNQSADDGVRADIWLGLKVLGYVLSAIVVRRILVGSSLARSVLNIVGGLSVIAGLFSIRLLSHSSLGVDVLSAVVSLITSIILLVAIILVNMPVANAWFAELRNQKRTNRKEQKNSARITMRSNMNIRSLKLYLATSCCLLLLLIVSIIWIGLRLTTTASPTLSKPVSDSLHANGSPSKTQTIDDHSEQSVLRNKSDQHGKNLLKTVQQETSESFDPLWAWRVKTVRNQFNSLVKSLEAERGPEAKQQAFLNCWDSSYSTDDNRKNGLKILLSDAEKMFDRTSLLDGSDTHLRSSFLILERSIWEASVQRGVPTRDYANDNNESQESFTRRLDKANAPRWSDDYGYFYRNKEDRDAALAQVMRFRQKKNDILVMIEFIKSCIRASLQDPWLESAALNNPQSGIYGRSINRVEDAINKEFYLFVGDTKKQKAFVNVYNELNEKYKNMGGTEYFPQLHFRQLVWKTPPPFEKWIEWKDDD